MKTTVTLCDNYYTVLYKIEIEEPTIVKLYPTVIIYKGSVFLTLNPLYKNYRIVDSLRIEDQ